MNWLNPVRRRQAPSNRLRSAVAFSVASAALLACSTPTRAAECRLAHIVVGTSPGGGGDTLARLLARHLNGQLGDNVIVENRTGADGVVAAQFVANAAPDGCTLLLATSGHMARPFAVKKLPYDTLTDLVGVTAVTRSPTLVVTAPTLQFNSPQGFVDLLKAAPGKYNYATPEILGQISTALFNHQVGVEAIRVPYRGSSQMMTDLASGAVHYASTSIAAGRALVLSGRIKAAGIAGDRRSDALPNVPTFKESGIDFVLYNRYGLLAPGKTPRPILDRIQGQIAAVLKEADVKQSMRDNGDEPVGNSVVAYQAELAKEYQLFKATAEQAGIVPE